METVTTALADAARFIHADAYDAATKDQKLRMVARLQRILREVDGRG